ncbi:hypothetical protein ACLOJK_015794 [Asimina triloba]
MALLLPLQAMSILLPGASLMMYCLMYSMSRQPLIHIQDFQWLKGNEEMKEKSVGLPMDPTKEVSGEEAGDATRTVAFFSLT